MDKLRILVADKLAPDGLGILQSQDDVEVEVRTGLSEDELAQVVGQFDGMIIRSGVKVTAKVLENPGRLRAIARAGVGVDNVDIEAATRAGVLVMNTPDANTISTAEHTLALMFALLRNIPAACWSLKKGEWDRHRFVGRQLAGKTLGIVGLGRVGRAVATRALALNMTVLAYDPFVTGQSALDGKVPLCSSLQELLPQVDILSVHAPLTPQTRGMIGAKEFELMKSGSYLINCARGGIVDEDALYEAIKSGKIAGAALDVYSTEPPQDRKLIELDQVVCTPHLGASTKEAQTAVSVEAAQALLDYLKRGHIRSAVNVTGLPARLSEKDLAFVDLAQRIGALLSPFCEGGIEEVTIATRGSALQEVGPMLGRYVLMGLLQPFFDTRLNIVNVPEFTQQRGIVVRNVATRGSTDGADILTITVKSKGVVHEIEGTVGQNGTPRILSIDGYRMDMVPEGQMLVIMNDDRPGVIGLVGTTLGQHKVNIADMTLSRQQDKALMVLKLDEPAPAEAIDALAKQSPPIRLVRTVWLPPVPRKESAIQ